MDLEAELIDDCESEGDKSSTVSKLIAFMKSAFRPSDFENIELVLIARERKLKLQKDDVEAKMKKKLDDLSEEIENKRKEYVFLEDKYAELELTNFVLEDEGKKQKKECEELNQKIRQLVDKQRSALQRYEKLLGEATKTDTDKEETITQLLVKGDSAKQRYEKLLEEAKKTERDKEEMIVKLKAVNGDLECAKKRAEAEVYAGKKKYGELLSRILRLEEDSKMLMKERQEKTESRKRQSENVDSAMDDLQTKENGFCFKKMNEPFVGMSSACNSPLNGSEGLKAEGSHTNDTAPFVTIEKNEPSNSNMYHTEPENLVLGIAEFDKKRDASEGSHTNEMVSFDTEKRNDPVSSKMQQGTPVRKRLVFESNGFNKTMDPPADIVVICESDDELPTTETNRKNLKKNSLSNSELKRKRSPFIHVSENDDDDDDVHDNTRNGDKKRTKQIQELVTAPKGCPANLEHFSTSLNLVYPATAHKCKEKINSGSPFSALLDDYVSDDSSTDLEDEEDNIDMDVDQFLLKLKKKNGDKIWYSEADMISALERDPVLCMKAVCAIYRQLTFMEGSLVTGNQGFAKYDVLRVTTLAKFLIDGDPQGKLKKSTTDLKKYDPKGLDECRNVATRYCKQLFEIYDKKQDPYFLPS